MSQFCSKFLSWRLFFFLFAGLGKNKQTSTNRNKNYKWAEPASSPKRNGNAEDALAGELWNKRHGRVEPWGFPVVSGIEPVAIDHNHFIKRIQ